MSYVRFKIKKLPQFFGVFCSLYVECKERAVSSQYFSLVSISFMPMLIVL